MESRDWLHYLYSLISTAQERFCLGITKYCASRQICLLRCLEMMQLEAPTDSLTKFLGKEKIEYVKRAYWKEDRHDPDLR